MLTNTYFYGILVKNKSNNGRSPLNWSREAGKVKAGKKKDESTAFLRLTEEGFFRKLAFVPCRLTGRVFKIEGGKDFAEKKTPSRHKGT